MARTFVAISFRSLPKVVRELIENGKKDELVSEVSKAKYSYAVRTAALHFFNKSKGNVQ